MGFRLRLAELAVNGGSILSPRKDRDMTDHSDNRVLGRKGARNLCNDELQKVSGGTIVITQFPTGHPDTLGDT